MSGDVERSGVLMERLARLEEKADVGARERAEFRASIERIHAKLDGLDDQLGALGDKILAAETSIRTLSWAGKLTIGVAGVIGGAVTWVASHWPK